jgi:transcriptional regulator with XRE-family HTH domain
VNAKRVSSTQCRAARAMLDWSIRKLSQQTGIANATLREYERGRDTLNSQQLHMLANALEKFGVSFTAASAGCGVILKWESVPSIDLQNVSSLGRL